MTFELSPELFGLPGYCPACGAPGIEVDSIPGRPLYKCPRGCALPRCPCGGLLYPERSKSRCRSCGRFPEACCDGVRG